MKTFWFLGLRALFAFSALSGLEPARGGIGENSREEIGELPPPDISAEQVAGQFEFPWSIAFLPEGSLLVTERVGRLQLVQTGVAPREVVGLPRILNHDHAGLLDVALDPGFTENRILYLSYVHGTRSLSSVRVLKARLDQQNLRVTEQRVIFDSTPAEVAQLFGGRMAVTANGHLFLTLGDRRNPGHAQDLSNHVGKIVRIRTDGTIPQDNPFISLADARPEIWTYGHRNPQGLAFDPRTNELWSHEHGPLGGDELNLIVAGRNYGWPVITHGLDYSGKPIGEGKAKNGLEQPVHSWTVLTAPSGLAVESKGSITVFWIGALAGQSLVRLEMENGRIVREHRLLEKELGRIRDVRISPHNIVYLITDSSRGALYRLDSTVEQAWTRRMGRRRLYTR
jgi:glucose/arabinose dehydrogenase